jgi:hypothetical protein
MIKSHITLKYECDHGNHSITRFNDCELQLVFPNLTESDVKGICLILGINYSGKFEIIDNGKLLYIFWK